MFQNQENEHVRQNSRDSTAGATASGAVNATSTGTGETNLILILSKEKKTNFKLKSILNMGRNELQHTGHLRTITQFVTVCFHRD